VLRAFAAAATALLALAPQCGAATVSARPASGVGPSSLRVDHAGGEDNSLVLRTGDGGATVTERGTAALRAADGCQQKSGRRVVCPGPLAAVDVRLGSGSDSLLLGVRTTTASEPEVTASGGDGGDSLAVERSDAESPRVLLRGDPGSDTLIGGPQGDRLQGGAGVDSLAGGKGDDLLVGDGGHSSAGHDELAGGGGFDVASWSDRKKRAGVLVDLRGAAHGGTAGEDDVLVSIEGAIGGHGDDNLIGDGGDNRLSGGDGHDVINGRRGDDRIDGGDGDDTLRGEGGADRIDNGASPQAGGIADFGEDILHCGSGRDVVTHAAAGRDPVGTDHIPQSCERLTFFGPRVAVPRLVAGTDEVAVEVAALRSFGATRRVRLEAYGDELGHSETVALGPREHRTVTVPLKEPLPSHIALQVQVAGQDEQSSGGPRPFYGLYGLVLPEL
jgi:Ca2+-binding RTX toxin-like protein